MQAARSTVKLVGRNVQWAKVARVVMATQTVRHCSTLRTNGVRALRFKKAAMPIRSQRFFRASVPTFGSYPSHKVVTMPALSPTMETGNVATWAKKEGDQVVTGDVIAEIETDKAVMEFEASEDGYLAKILLAAGSKDIPVGKPLYVVVEDKDDVAAFAAYQSEDAPAAPASTSTTPASTTSTAPQIEKAESPKAVSPSKAIGGGRGTPIARRLAREMGFDLSAIPGTGPDGRVIEKDVYAYQKTASEAIPTSESLLSSQDGGDIQQVLAARLNEAKRTIPQWYLTSEINMDAIIKLNNSLPIDKDNNKVGLHAFILKAVAIATKTVPASNSAWLGSAIRQYDSVDIAYNVVTDKGTLSPVIGGAESKGLKALSSAIESATELAKSGAVSANYQGGTVTVNAIGLNKPGVLNAVSIVMPPHSVCLTLGSMTKRVVPGLE
eukprot:Ihof_evm2s581 gene=Ihof_evmTU2s581